MARHEPQTNIITLMRISRVVLWKKIQIAMSKIGEKQLDVQECVIFYTSSKISRNFQGIHH